MELSRADARVAREGSGAEGDTVGWSDLVGREGF